MTVLSMSTFGMFPHLVSVWDQLIQLFAKKIFTEIVLEYTCILKKFKKVRKCGKKWGFKKQYIKPKS